MMGVLATGSMSAGEKSVHLIGERQQRTLRPQNGKNKYVTERLVYDWSKTLTVR